ncbi:putative WD-40 repeat protein [Hordeum vulgare]|uniref:Uncharacterized protein n=1 Tax=Hordeum vulgare subsp. vulgare TaxID=112509 RepID=A0A8I6WTE4_HORVV|nr:putative WD-40 repeat protein [Hordeum vulgare]KAI5017840.1 hypothetical protein ZWY2020_042728 [Hordeum vulgare]
MQRCFPSRSTWRQASQHGGGVTVVSCGEEEGSVKIVVSRGELERIAAGVSRRQCRNRHVVVPSAPGPPGEEQSAREGERDRLLRRWPESEGGAAVRRGDWRPELGGIPEEA